VVQPAALALALEGEAMGDVDTRYLGPRPEPLWFPFDAADGALDAMTNLCEKWQACVRTHEDAVVPARIDFEGRVRQEFDQNFNQAMDDIRNIEGLLQGDIDALGELIKHASRVIEARNQEIAEWDERQWRQNAYEETVRQQ
jgi:hypothetical protein